MAMFHPEDETSWRRRIVAVHIVGRLTRRYTPQMIPIVVAASDEAQEMNTNITRQISHWNEVRQAYCTREVRPLAVNDLAMQVEM